MKTQNKAKAIFLILLILFIGYTATAQEQPKYKVVGNEIVRTTTPQAKTSDLQTQLTFKVKDSVFKVWKSEKGAHYVIRTSKKTGKQYKQYLKL